MALRTHLKFERQNYDNKAKPIFEATGHELYYYAASEDDEAGKLFVSATLDRKLMWDCNLVSGSSTAFEFTGLQLSANNTNMVLKRELPCPCPECFQGRFPYCSHENIVGMSTLHVMKLASPVDCPDILVVPLNNYANKILLAFIKRKGGVIRPTSKKDDLIKYIEDNYREDIDFTPAVVV